MPTGSGVEINATRVGHGRPQGADPLQRVAAAR